jgi:cobalamin biosynthesis protein CbiD
MSVSNWTDADTTQALQIWADYQKQHDVTVQNGQTVGIDSSSGRVWFGESAIDIPRQMDAEGLDTPLMCLRVGHDYYVRKGGRR